MQMGEGGAGVKPPKKPTPPLAKYKWHVYKSVTKRSFGRSDPSTRRRRRCWHQPSAWAHTQVRAVCAQPIGATLSPVSCLLQGSWCQRSNCCMRHLTWHHTRFRRLIDGLMLWERSKWLLRIMRSPKRSPWMSLGTGRAAVGNTSIVHG